jgi:hypothetical protein
VILAHVVATLDQVSAGRLILGVGIGLNVPSVHAEFQAAGVPLCRRSSRKISQVSELSSPIGRRQRLSSDSASPIKQGSIATPNPAFSAETRFERLLLRAATAEFGVIRASQRGGDKLSIAPCMGFSLSRSSPGRRSFPSSVSWFDLKARFFVPTCASLTSMRVGSVQVWLSPQPYGMLRPCQAIP